jgi:hypothetical protein
MAAHAETGPEMAFEEIPPAFTRQSEPVPPFVIGPSSCLPMIRSDAAALHARRRQDRRAAVKANANLVRHRAAERVVSLAGAKRII